MWRLLEQVLAACLVTGSALAVAWGLYHEYKAKKKEEEKERCDPGDEDLLYLTLFEEEEAHQIGTN